MATEIIWRSEQASELETASEHFVVECYLEGQNSFDPWTVYPVTDPKDQEAALLTAESILDTEFFNAATATSQTIIATRVCRVTI